LQVCLTLATIFISSHAAFHQGLYDSFPDHDHSWTGHDDHLEFASSERLPSYSSFSHLKKRHPDFGSTSYESPKEWFSPSIKKEPREDKSFKKVVSPFYTITEKDSQKYKDIVLKSGVPYCQETKTKRSFKGKNAKDSLVCYKCRNPKNGATYEQCSYVSQPLAESSNVEEVATMPSVFRSRRSNSDEALASFENSDYKNRDNPYRFSEKLFSDATDEVPAEYRKKDEECEKVVKDTMVCMVCRDKKSNGKYEQCSYVSRPTEKKYAYSKSTLFKNPERSDKEKEDTRKSDREYSEESKPVREISSSEKEEPEKHHEEAKESSNCKKVEKDSKTCTVCKDPETGTNSEKCSYAYQPDDKVYKYSRSKSFGNSQPKSSSKGSPGYSDYTEKSRPEGYSRDYSFPESFYEKPSGSSYFKDKGPRSSYRQADSGDSKSTEEPSGYDRSKSESERIAETIEPSKCKEVQKDSMTCKVCTDPKTGSNSEQCSYKYQPNEKNFAYSKSRSFGGPTKAEDRSYDGSEKKETREPSYSFSPDKGRYSADSDAKQSYGETKRAHSADSDAKRPYREFPSSSETKSESKEEPTTKSPSKVDDRFYDAFKQKAEIQKYLQDFQKEDRSKCKKLMRDKMTCYECVDEKGFRQEECAFVTSESDPEKSEENESKEEPEPGKKVTRSPIIDKRVDDFALDSDASASEDVQVRRDKPAQNSKEESKEVEPYEYVSETRPVFDKVLGFTLPAYMLDTSEQEQEFDKTV
ncbi:hypothetical protein WN55_08905, partial [Dufourea novaeangliae]